MRWWRRARDTAGDRPKLTQVPVGYDRLAAQLLAARCQGAGLSVKLLTMDESGNAPGITALQEHMLLVREDDLPAVSELLADADRE